MRSVISFFSAIAMCVVGYLLHEITIGKKVSGISEITYSDMVFPAFVVFTLSGLFAAAIGWLRNRGFKVEINSEQIIPFLALGVGSLCSHLYNLGFTEMVDASLVLTVIMFGLALIGVVKNVLLFVYNRSLDL